MRNALFGIGALGFVVLPAPGVTAMGYAHSGPAAVTCEMGGTGQLTVQTPSLVLADAPGTTPFQVRLDLSGVTAARPGIPAQISGSVTFSLQPGEGFEDYDNRAAAATAELVASLQGMAAGERAFLSGSGNLDDGTWKAVAGTYRLHAKSLALAIPGAGSCHVSDFEPVGEFFVQPPATDGGEDPALSPVVATIQRVMFALVVVAVGIFLYANRPKRFRRGRTPHTASPSGPQDEQARARRTCGPQAEQARAWRKLPEPVGFESRPHLRLFRTFTSIAGGCLLTLGLVVSCVIDRSTTLDDLPSFPGRPSPPVPDRAGPTPSPFHAGSRQEFSTTRPTATPPPAHARPPALPGR
ncbi:hypothetical protein [Nonomuraea sp. GTA35]|uniref:hypothetical protein n=1 Tax=Nonomuraea sp. GTA35 TaxID=1676746 RepID=UPI0035C14969